MKATGGSIPLGQGWPGLLAGNPYPNSLLFLNPLLKGDLETENPKKNAPKFPRPVQKSAADPANPGPNI